MDLKNYLTMTDATRARLEQVSAGYRLFHDDPERCRPMIHIHTPVQGLPTWEEQLADPLVMLRASLDHLRPHLEMGDDFVPTVRVEFGTAQVAVAFGCRMAFPKNSPPAAGNHVLARAEDVRNLQRPALDAGWYGKVAEWTEVWKRHLPPGILFQIPDIQSAFNSAHLIRGSDIFTDFYDSPEDVDRLLDKITDFMVAITRHMKAMIGDEPGWFRDWGVLWKGAARISNCSMQMISPSLYREHVLSRDIRFFEAIGGGRVHYCGLAGDVIDDFFKVPSITGLDVDVERHDFYALCERAPERVVLQPTGWFCPDAPERERLLRGDWPRKRNIVVNVWAASVEEGRVLLERLRRARPD